MRNPFFQKQTQARYVEDQNGKTIRFGNDRDGAFQAWHQLAASGETSGTR